MIQSKSSKFQKYATPQRTTFNLVKPPFTPCLLQSNIICEYCDILGHKSLHCQKKKCQQALAQNQSNNFTKDKNHVHALGTVLSSPKVSLFWFLDFGMNQHMIPFKSLFCDYYELPTSRAILLEGNSSHQATDYGSVLLKSRTLELLLLTNILQIPTLTRHLLSIA